MDTSTNARSTVGRQSVNSRTTVGRRSITVGRQSLDAFVITYFLKIDKMRMR